MHNIRHVHFLSIQKGFSSPKLHPSLLRAPAPNAVLWALCSSSRYASCLGALDTLRNPLPPVIEAKIPSVPFGAQRLADMGVEFIEEKPVGAEKQKDFSGIKNGEVVILPAFGAPCPPGSALNLLQGPRAQSPAQAAASRFNPLQPAALRAALRAESPGDACFPAARLAGASVQEMKLLNDRGVQIIDTTCPWVSKAPPAPPPALAALLLPQSCARQVTEGHCGIQVQALQRQQAVG